MDILNKQYFNLVGYLPESLTKPSPLIEMYKPKAQSNSYALVILPGGAYGKLSKHEGKGYADFFLQHGFTCFVVNYRLGAHGFRHPCMLEDTLSALYVIRNSSAELEIDPDKIGIIGSSAGGHLAALTITVRKSFYFNFNVFPNFAVLCYPVIQFIGPHRHEGTIRNLLGDKPSQSQLTAMSIDLQIDEEVCPCFLWHSIEDSSVPCEHSISLALALKKKKVHFELHLYQKGKHGIGLNTPYSWGNECIRWILGLEMD